MSDEAVDLATFRALEDTAGAEFTAELVATFADEVPHMLDELRAALEASDTGGVRRIAHSLKSNGLTFGAMKLAAMARELEQDAQGAVARRAARPLDALAEEYARVAAALAELRHA